MPDCALCNAEIENTFLEKINGTIVKIKKDEKNKEIYICSICQKKHKDKLNEEILKNYKD